MMSKKNGTIILGSGIAGLAVNYFLNDESVIFEKENYWGGLCHSFSLEGFVYDTFIHLSFTNSKEVIDLFSKSTNSFIHNPIAYNYYHGNWIKHPVQNNIFALTTEEKVNIIEGFSNRKNSTCNNYEEWLRIQFGDYFAEQFSLKYTKKYWSVEAYKLETKWIGDRIYKPPIREVIKGAFEEDEINRYYAKEMRYPCEGGYQRYLETIIDEKKINLNSRATLIDPIKKLVKIANGELFHYNNLISTIPLPELCKIIEGVPVEIIEASNKLNYTSGVIVSLGFNKPDIPKHLWYYIYDEDILPSRVYSPSLKSRNNVPKGCSSVQAEYYYSNLRPLKYTLDEVLEKTVEKLGEIMSFTEDDIIVKDVRHIKYANVIFTENIYKNRQIVHDYLDEIGIKYAGRFGEWDYLWSDQSLLSGKKVANELNKL